MSRHRYCVVSVVLIALLGGFAGCGGGGSSPGSTAGLDEAPGLDNLSLFGADPGVSTPGRVDAATALVHVDVASGAVEVTPFGDQTAASRAVFTGAAVGLQSSLLLDLPGSTGVRVLDVSLVNHWGLPLGQRPDGTVTGLRVLFGDFVNVSNTVLDLRSRTTVSTLAGTGAAGTLDGPTSTATLNNPIDLAVGADGAVYFSEYVAGTIRKVNQGQVTLLAGGGAGAGAGAGAAARLTLPRGVAYDPRDGALFAASVGQHQLLRVAPDGRVTVAAGSGVAGSSDGPGTTARLSMPVGVAVAPDGAVYVTELSNRIRRVELVGTDPLKAADYQLTTIAGSGAAGFADGVGSAAVFNAPSGISASPDGSLFVADANNNRIRRVSPTGEVVTIAGTGLAGAVDGRGDQATLNYPHGLEWTSRGIVVADRYSQRIRLLTQVEGTSGASPTHWMVRTLAGTGASGSTDGSGATAQFNQPIGVTAEAGGVVYVADYKGHRVRRIDLTGDAFQTGEPTATTQTEPVQLSNATGVLPGPDGRAMPFIDYQWYTLAPPGRSVLAPGETSPPQKWWFVIPEGVTAFQFTVTVEAATGGLVPADAGVGAGSPNVMVTTVAGSTANAAGYVDGRATEARFWKPNVSADRFGNLYIGDENNGTIRRIGADGMVTTIAGSPVNSNGEAAVGSTDGSGDVARFWAPSGIAISPDGSVLYVADTVNHTIRRMVLAAGADPRVAGNWSVTTIAGYATSAGYRDGVGSVARFTYPRGILLTATGDLYVVEHSYGNRVRRLHFTGGDPASSASWQVSLVAGAVDGATGTADGAGSAARFSSPCALAADPSGNLYIADGSNRRIRKVTADGVVSTFAGPTGAAIAAAYADGVGTAARFGDLAGLAVDSSGYIYVAENLGVPGQNPPLIGSRIRRISPSRVVTTVAGQASSYATLDGTGASARFWVVGTVACTADGDLYVADAQCLRKIQRIIGAGER